MNTMSRRTIVLWNAIAVLTGLLPILLYWLVFAREPSVSVAEAHAQLAQTNPPSLLLDARPAAACASNPLPGAVNVPFDALHAMTNALQLPPAVSGRRLLVICETGLSGALAVRRLRAMGWPEARNVSGGVEAWLAYGDGQKSAAAFRPMSRFEQWMAVFIAFVIKPIYMLLSFVLIVWLWRQRATDLTALRWGLIWFWIGENGCSIDFLFYARGSNFWEYLHGYGMAAGFAFIAYAALEGIDHRVVKFSPAKERCAALSLCHACVKYADVPCGLKRLFALTIPGLALLALMPLSGGFILDSYDATIVNKTYHYFHLITSQLFELRFCPVLAVGLLAASWLVLMFKRHEPVAVSKILLAAGLGPMGFGILRMIFVATFRDQLVWFDVWEELTELLSIFSLAAVLWVFRDGVLTRKPASASEVSAPVEARA